MECDFIVEDDDPGLLPALNGWEAVVFELEDDPAYFDSSTAANRAIDLQRWSERR